MAKVGRKKIVTKLIGREKHLFVYTFGNDFPHVEPCRYCFFGKQSFVELERQDGTKYKEQAWACNKPKEYATLHCTAVHRKDKKNVYFLKLYKTND